MEIIILPSLFAICLKLAIFTRYHESLRRDNFHLGMFFLAIFIYNIFEFIGLDGQYSHQTSLVILLAFYCGIIFIIHAYLCIALEYSKFNWHLNRVKAALNLLLAFVVINIILNRAAISDVGYVTVGDWQILTREAGDYFWMVGLYIASGTLSALALLLRGVLTLSQNLDRQRCLVLLLATLPAVVVTLVVISLQALGWHVTGAMFLSLSLTLMLGIMVYAEEKTRLFRLLTLIPFTRENRLHRQLLAGLTGCIAISDDPTAQQSINLRKMMKEFEGSVVEHVLDYYGGNQKKTANALGVSEATVSRRARSCARKPERGGSYTDDSLRISE